MSEPKHWTEFTIFKQLGVTPKIEPEASFPLLRDSVCEWLGGEQFGCMRLNCPNFHDINKPDVENHTIVWNKWERQLKSFFKDYCPADYHSRRWTFEGVVVFFYYWSCQQGYGAYELQILLNRLCASNSIDNHIEVANRIYNLATRVPAYKRFVKEDSTLTSHGTDFFWDRLSAHIRNRSPLIHCLPNNIWQLAYHNMAEDQPVGVDQVVPDDPLTAFKFPNQYFFLPIRVFE